MTTTIKIAADGTMTLPEVLCKTKRLKPGSRLRVTETGDNILLTPVHPPAEEELDAVIEVAGGAGPVETRKNRKQVQSAIERVRARAREAQGRG
jgi:bifunctional DNA-binding transcriptional regulator/antitoxin component of YhaV-PrlF toxin-antitoxin module